VTKEITLSGGFFADTDFDFDARLALGAAACGIGDTGLVLATLARVVDGDRQSWFDAWCDVAATLDDQGQEAAGRGHVRTGRWALLTAAEHYAKALMVIDGLADQTILLPTFHEHRKCWGAVGGVAIVIGAVILLLVPVIPFTEQYAKQSVPREEWGSPTFKRVNHGLSVAWGHRSS
jgi:hypothetical protein